jgi:uncharacterized membrane-anchored protein
MRELLTRRLLVAGALLALLAGFNWSAAQKERLRDEGAVVLLELAPVDPRALLLGDYMALEYRMNRQASPPPEQAAACVMRVRLDENRVAAFARWDDGGPPASGEQLLRCKSRHRDVQAASPAFFFQEGYAGDFAAARYGELRVSPQGDSLLVALRDAAFQRIAPQQNKTKQE